MNITASIVSHGHGPELAIPWPLTSAPTLSAKDVNGVPFAVAVRVAQQ